MGNKKRFSIIQIQKWLQERVSSCSLCQSNAWELEPELFSVRLAKAMVPTRSREAKHVECVILTCKECGNTHFINAQHLLASADRSEAEKKENKDIDIKESADENIEDDLKYVAED